MSVKPTEVERRQAGKLVEAFFDAIKATKGPSPRAVIAQALADQRAQHEALIARIRELAPSAVKAAESELSDT